MKTVKCKYLKESPATIELETITPCKYYGGWVDRAHCVQVCPHFEGFSDSETGEFTPLAEMPDVLKKRKLLAAKREAGLVKRRSSYDVRFIPWGTPRTPWW